jgi:hypothetical protein
MVKIIDLKEGEDFRFRGAKRDYTFQAFCGVNENKKGMVFYTCNGKQGKRKIFPFTLVHRLLSPSKH